MADLLHDTDGQLVGRVLGYDGDGHPEIDYPEGWGWSDCEADELEDMYAAYLAGQPGEPTPEDRAWWAAECGREIEHREFAEASQGWTDRWTDELAESKGWA